ncbi:LysR family transcriptional regulator [Actinokineospora inagensis]|uniref:LysR family transcriptional regulator n=1 Tax=Actinokineospora inagensis TaxID=103730 RepID=UPI000418FBCA|nr:LysR family transcriptional regulator [Actinokineospora inagensis]
MELEVRHLRALAAIDETGSLTQAARRLGMSQPALSGLLQRIERTVGGRLFFRAEYGCLPTPLGAEVLNEARVVLSGMTAIAERVGEWSRRGLPSDPLRVGGYCGFLHVEISRWLQDQPWCTGVSVQEDLDERISIDKVAIGALDLALVYLPPLPGLTQPPGVRSVVVHPEEPVFLAVAHDHPLAGRASVSLADIAEHPWVDEPPGTSRWSTYVNQVCHEHGLVLDQPHSTQCLATQLELISAKLAIGPALATARNRPGNIVIRPIDDNPMRQELRLFYRPASIIATHIEEIHNQVLTSYQHRQGCNPAFDHWWLNRGGSLALTG